MKIAAIAGAAVALTAVSAFGQPASFVDLGVIGGEGTYSFDTSGSLNITGGFDLDTEIGLWAGDGTLLASDDDGLGFPFSIVTEALTAGEYYIGIGEFDSIFEDGFINSGTSLEDENALAVLNIDGVFADSQDLIGSNTVDGETAFWRVEVIPAPGAVALAGLAGVAGLRRRR